MGSVEWAALVAAEMSWYEHRMTQAERAVYWAIKLLGRPYVLGGENPVTGTDCSGVICFALWMMGFDIRTTAHRLQELLFRQRCNDQYDRDRLKAVFFFKGGRATHVSLQVGRGAVIDAWSPSEPVILKAFDPVIDWYRGAGYGYEWREMDWSAAKEVSEGRRECWDIDPVLKVFRPTGG